MCSLGNFPLVSIAQYYHLLIETRRHLVFCVQKILDIHVQIVLARCASTYWLSSLRNLMHRALYRGLVRVLCRAHSFGVGNRRVPLSLSPVPLLLISGDSFVCGLVIGALVVFTSRRGPCRPLCGGHRCCHLLLDV